MAHSDSLSATSALAEAGAIAQSANGRVDWYREPLTERERKIRARYLERFFEDATQLEDDGPLHCLVLRCTSLKLRALSQAYKPPYVERKVASDMLLAVARAQAIDQHNAECDADELADIIAEIDSDAA